MNGDWSLIAAPMAAGVLVVFTHVLWGRRVLDRGIIFIDLTIAQVAALGVIIVGTLSPESDTAGQWQTQAAAALAALLAAGLLSVTEHYLAHLQEALIGSLYVISASVAVLLLAHNPHGAEHLHSLLAGQILWTSWDQLPTVALLYAGILGIWFFARSVKPAVFYLLFALTVTVSVQLVGIYLVFASLIFPAMATHGQTEKTGLIHGYVLAIAAYAAGLLLSLRFDLPAGPVIVCSLASFSLLSASIRAVMKTR